MEFKTQSWVEWHSDTLLWVPAQASSLSLLIFKCRCKMNSSSRVSRSLSESENSPTKEILIVPCCSVSGVGRKKKEYSDFLVILWCLMAPAWQDVGFCLLCFFLENLPSQFLWEYAVSWDVKYYKMHSFGLMWIYRLQGGGAVGWHWGLRNVLKAWITFRQQPKETTRNWLTLLNTQAGEKNVQLMSGPAKTPFVPAWS